jgi:hypothetical protein
MNNKPLTLLLDPSKVEELCRDNPWSKQGLKVSGTFGFGTIPEQFEKSAQAMPDGSELQKTYYKAYLEAREIYKHQILADVRKISKGKTRAELEGINEGLGRFAKSLEKEDNYVSNRLIWAAHMVGDWYYKNNPGAKSDKPVSGKGYQQFRVGPGGLS